jgi:ABC-2 type transport system ATP-binding protein
MTPILNVENLHKRFARRIALGGVSFELAADSVTVLLGTNGAGKSTLLRCIQGLLEPDAGRVTVLGLDPLRAPSQVRSRLGYVPDQPDAYPWMTLRDLFRFLRGQYPSWSDERAKHLAARLEAPLTQTFASMSRGEAAKSMLAAALAHHPPLVLLDEAFSRLAPPVHEQVLSIFLEEAPADGGAALIATHDLNVAARVADRVLLLDQGRLTADVEVDALLEAADGSQSLSAALRALYPEPEGQEQLA